MKIKESPGYICFRIVNVMFLILLSLVMIYPLLYVIFASLSNAAEFMSHEGLLLAPLSLNFESYKQVLENPMVWSGYKNTLIVLVAATCLNLVLSILAAFVLSRKYLAWRGILMGFVIVTMYFSGGLIPTYMNVRSMGLDNTLWALIIPGAINVHNMIILRTAFENVPASLEESARLDGAGPFSILTRIVLPLSVSSIAVIALYYAVGHWNAWFNAMIYLRDRTKYPLQLVLREILIQNNTTEMMGDISTAEQSLMSETIKYAVIVVSTLPILMGYPMIQRYFVKGVMVGAVKG